MTRTRVYVAGPYSGDNVITILRNMRNGMNAAEHLLRLGYAPFCPHLDYHFELHSNHQVQDYYDYSMAFLEVCDYVVLLPGWEKSKGCNAEKARADGLNIPIMAFDEFLKILPRTPRATRIILKAIK